ncbi:hypothetical protein [Specibacter cremeus]|uniref:hypothetical protein n=1 Tax=Specibacter cremeus TaxID=1629051 RepID=UPI000F79CCDD|nr:hypothetical protein [Specibacter cremeus]
MDSIETPPPAGSDPADEPPLETGPAKAPRRRGGKMTAVAIAAVVLFGGGLWTGTAVADPTASDAYKVAVADADSSAVDVKRMAGNLTTVQGELETLRGEVTSREAAADAKSVAADKHEAEVKTAEAAVKKREDAVTGAEKAKAANTVGDGTWVVGVDIAPGTYRTTADVGATCYWGIYASGSNGADIINNDIPGGGRPSVTLAAGQDFKSSRCGTWEKQ